MVKVCFINGSPKAQGKSNSDFFINQIKKVFDDDINSVTYYASKINENKSLLDEIIKNDKIIFVSPLYADSLPSGMLKFLSLFEEYLKDKDCSIDTYGFVNCGFFEGDQCKHALDMFKYFSRRSKLNWKFGISAGGGEYYASLNDKFTSSIHSESICNSIKYLASDLKSAHNNAADNFYTNPDKMGGFLYRLNANFDWYCMAFKIKKANIFKLRKKLY